MCATWVNIVFSFRAISQLVSKADADAFNDESFRQGLAARSTYLGDPTNRRHAGHRNRWHVGGPKNEADILVIVAADDKEDLVNMVKVIKTRAANAQLQLIFEQLGENLPGALRGHEHFGFKDGISQPGVRGKVSILAGDFITPRYMDATVDLERARIFAKPGTAARVARASSCSAKIVRAAKHSVCLRRRRSRHARMGGDWVRILFVAACGRTCRRSGSSRSVCQCTGHVVEAVCLNAGRTLAKRCPAHALRREPRIPHWPATSGPTTISFQRSHACFGLRPIPGYGGDVDSCSGAADLLGKRLSALRTYPQVQPRDIATDLGKPHDSLIRMILRRGIPFGPPIAGVKRPARPS